MGRGGVKGGSDCVPRGSSLRRGRSDGSSAVFFKRSSVQQKQALLHKVCKIMLALYFIIMLETRRENGKVARGRNEPSKSAHASTGMSRTSTNLNLNLETLPPCPTSRLVKRTTIPSS